MANPKFICYQRNNGTNEFQSYLNTLDDRNAGKMAATISQSEEKGPAIARQQRWIAPVRKGSPILEIRCHVSNNQRRGICFLDKQRNQYIIVTGFNKKTQQLKNSDIHHWEKLQKEYYDTIYTKQKGRVKDGQLQKPDFPEPER